MKIWKASVPERCQIFMWLFKHERLLTNLSKSKKGLGSAACNLCGNVCESIIHAMRDCFKCQQVWRSLVPSDILEHFFSVDTKKWINMNLNYNGSGNPDWSNTWIISCHTLWSWRNIEEHKEDYARPPDSIIHILNRVEDYKHAMTLYKAVREEGNGNNYIGWKPPAGNMIKLNTDGASKNVNIAGCGCVLRYQNGSWKGGFSKYVGNCSAILAEFWGVLEGLNLLVKLGYKQLEINSDSMEVVIALEEGNVRFIECVSILRKIMKIISTLDVVITSHVYRNANVCADYLANRGCEDKKFMIYKEASQFLRTLLDLDAIGVVSPVVFSV